MLVYTPTIEIKEENRNSLWTLDNCDVFSFFSTKNVVVVVEVLALFLSTQMMQVRYIDTENGNMTYIWHMPIDKFLEQYEVKKKL